MTTDPLPPLDTVNARLKYMRVLRNLSQSALARRARLTQQTVWRHEATEAPIPQGTLQRYVRVLRVSEEWMRYGLGPGPGENPQKTVERYLKTERGKSCDAEVAALLARVSYSSLAVHRLTVDDVHRVRRLIETNRELARDRERESITGDEPAPESHSR